MPILDRGVFILNGVVFLTRPRRLLRSLMLSLTERGSAYFSIALTVLFLFCFGVCVSNAAESAPDQTAAVKNEFPFTAEVVGEEVNLRTDSTSNSEIICKLEKGLRLEVVNLLYGWYKVRLPQKAPAYIRADLCFKAEDKPVNFTPQDSSNIRFNAIKIIPEKVNIRLRPDETAPIIGRAMKNEVIKFSEVCGNWYRIVTPGDAYGYVHANFLRKVALESITSAQSQQNSLAVEGDQSAAVINPGAQAKPGAQLINDNQQAVTVVYEGIVKAYGIVFKRQATHKLITADKNVLLLKGDKQSLNAVVNRKVRITGKEISDPGKKRNIIEVVKIEVLD